MEKRNVSASHYDSGSFLFGVLGFFIPVVGLVLYLVWKNEKPKNAKISGVGGLIGFCVPFAFFMFMAFMSILLSF